VPPERYHALRQVRARLRVPISVGEPPHMRWDFVPIFEKALTANTHRHTASALPDSVTVGAPNRLAIHFPVATVHARRSFGS
jgi:hypothetical protein